MLKFLRHYNKWILAVFGTLLMIVFLIPQALDTLARTAGARAATVAKIGDRVVSPDEWEQARSELLLLDRTGIRQQVFPFVEAPEHWFLLSREAREAGLIGANAIESLSDEDLAALSGVVGGNPRLLGETSATQDGVLRLIGLYRNAGQPSDRRLRYFAERLMHGVSAELAVLEAKADESIPVASEAEQLEQFQAYRDIIPGEGDMGFGYRMPDRFKLEWLEVDIESVQRALEASDSMNRVALFIHWNRNQFRDGLPPFVEGEEAPESVRRHLLDRLTEEKLDDIAKYAYSQIRTRLHGLPERNGFVVLPEDWSTRSLTMTELAESLRERLEIELPAYQSIGDRWLSIDDLPDLGDISRAVTDKFGSTPVGLRQLVGALKEFGGDGDPPVQQGIAMPPLRASLDAQDGSIYIPRVIATDPSRPPHSLDEVRDTVIEDLRRLAAYRRLTESIPELESDARQRGMLEVALDHGTSLRRASEITMCSRQLLDLLLQRQLPPQALPSSLPVIGADEPTVRAIVDRALELPMTDLSSVPDEQRIFALAVESRLSVVIVRLTKQLPLTAERYRRLATSSALQGLLLESEINVEAAQKAFSFERMADRHDLEMQAPPADTQPDEGEPDDSGASGAIAEIN